MGTLELLWAFMSTHGQSWVWSRGAISNHKHSRELRAPRNHTLQCSWLPISSHKCSWVIISDHQCSWLPECVIQQFKKNVDLWDLIFLKSTWNGLLENVQDWISYALGSQEIQQTKAGKVLGETPYFHFYSTCQRFHLLFGLVLNEVMIDLIIQLFYYWFICSNWNRKSND